MPDEKTSFCKFEGVALEMNVACGARHRISKLVSGFKPHPCNQAAQHPIKT